MAFALGRKHDGIGLNPGRTRALRFRVVMAGQKARSAVFM
jgi:hypothetical protein